MTTIYGIVDPRCGRIRYVGKTKGPIEDRLYMHLREPQTNPGSRNRKVQWLRELEELGLTATITEIDTCGDEHEVWVAAEKKWIAHYRELHGDAMTNGRAGGQGPRLGRRPKEKVKPAAGEVYSLKAVYSIKETAKILNVCEKTVRRLVASGEIQAFRVGRQFRIKDEWLPLSRNNPSQKESV